MIRLGVVAAGPALRIADGTQASAGDLILCTRNDHTVHAREPGRTLANGDLLRIEQVTAAGLIVAGPWTPTRPRGSGSGPTEIDRGSHVVSISHPREVAEVIVTAVRACAGQSA